MSADPGPVRGLFFDLGGTLFSYSNRGMGRVVFETAEALDIALEPEQIGEAWRRASEAAMRRYATLDYFLHRDLFRDTLKGFAAQFGAEVPEPVLARFEEAQRLAVVEHLPIREECHEALAALKERGLYLSIVSNIDDDYLVPLVNRHDLDRWLDHWISSERARSCKPHTGIFRYALETAGLDVSEALFVGDSLHHDIAGASAVGMRSARVVEPGVKTPLTAGLKVTAEPDYQIRRLTELVGIVDALNG